MHAPRPSSPSTHASVSVGLNSVPAGLNTTGCGDLSPDWKLRAASALAAISTTVAAEPSAPRLPGVSSLAVIIPFAAPHREHSARHDSIYHLAQALSSTRFCVPLQAFCSPRFYVSPSSSTQLDTILCTTSSIPLATILCIT